MNLGIVAAKDNERAERLAADLFRELSADGVDVDVDHATAAAIGVQGVDVDAMTESPLVVSIGGDGTFLFAARHVGPTPILGVNLGEVGFLNAVPPSEALAHTREELEHVRERGVPRYREVPRLEARGDGWSIPPGLNEVVVMGPGRGPGRGIDIEVRVDGSRYTGGHADGVLVATPTGSTAYNLSEGGPLIHPSVDGVVVTEMVAAEPMRPLVVGFDREIVIRATGADHAVVSSDSEQCRVDTPAKVRVGLADEPGRIAGPRSDFFEAIEKLD